MTAPRYALQLAGGMHAAGFVLTRENGRRGLFLGPHVSEA